MTRIAPRPPGDRTIQLFGDLHFSSLTALRRTKIIDNQAMVNVPTPAAHVFAGDWTTIGSDVQIAEARAWVEDNFDNAPIYGTIGNHDIQDEIRTPESACEELGLGERFRKVELGFVTLVFAFPGDTYVATNNGSRFSVEGLAALDAVLATTSGPVWIVCHYPLYNTHLGGESTHWRSVDSGYFAGSMATTASSADVEAVIADYPGVEAWLSGHTHTKMDTTTVLTTKTVGGRPIACINGSTVLAPNKNPTVWGECVTLFVTRTEADTIEVRVRNHGSSSWFGFGAQGRVVTFTPT